ncbi:glycoside hydrolase family 13 protein [Bacillus horti]|uniref:Glycosidase n=1 Tax=Caldalkalibacillus horti TaxID=77523 RepID=A0ABT9W2Q6_9BACI|nr:glycoside hydrolase family 13 protein [Bacillus horti]MDQ0167516.1 glycosidase [Bacillus horti]
MNKEAVLHHPSFQYAYACTKNSIQLRIRTKKSDLQSISLLFGDGFDWHDGKWNYQQQAVTKNGSCELFDYWEITLNPPNRRLRYAFILESKEERLFYCEKGFYTDVIYDPGYYFCFPFLHEHEEFQTPDWVKDTIWYQIFPERFANGNSSNDPEDTLAWNSADPTPTNHFGGDIEGITAHLDYLQELGINGIYLTPIFKAYSNHKYDTIDYLAIDPNFGDEAAFKTMVEECHKRGIRVMLDAVFNHSGFYFPPFQDVLEKGEKSKYKDWFHIHEFPIQTEPKANYHTFAFTPFMPKLNTAHPEVKEYLLNVATHWIEKYDIDGWRLDVANEVDHEFWREFRKAVRSVKEDVYILGELWHDSTPWLYGDQFDSVMNYPFQTNVLDLFVRDRLTPKQFKEKMTSVYYMYPKPITEVLFNLVGSHDTPRILTECKDSVEDVKLILTLLLTYEGSPCIYYGDEIGLTGGMDPGCRKCMPWDEAEYNLDLLDHTKKLIALRKREGLLRNQGTLTWMEHEGLLLFKVTEEEKSIYVLINPTLDEQHVTLEASDGHTQWHDEWQNKAYATTASVQVTVPKKQFAILSSK